MESSGIARMVCVRPNLVGSSKWLGLHLVPGFFSPQAATAHPAVDTEKNEFYGPIGHLKAKLPVPSV